MFEVGTEACVVWSKVRLRQQADGDLEPRRSGREIRGRLHEALVPQNTTHPFRALRVVFC